MNNLFPVSTSREVVSRSKFPVRISICTFNCWGTHNWPDRRLPLSRAIATLLPDVILVQEASDDIIATILSTSVDYACIKDSQNEGWTRESNIIYNEQMFELLESGFSNLEMPDLPLRGLFWCRLRVRSETSVTLFVSTAHLPWVGSKAEIESGINVRIPVTKKVCRELKRLVFSHADHADDTCIFAGDFNEDFHPLRILADECGMREVFSLLDTPAPITHPLRPSVYDEEIRPSRTLDWYFSSFPSFLPSLTRRNVLIDSFRITCRTASNCRVISAFAKNVLHSFPPPSDHAPVVAIFEWRV